MKNISLFALSVAILASASFTSCKDDTVAADDSTSRDCIISAAAMGTLSRTVTLKTTAGADSTLNVTVTGSYYPLYIDQVNYRIYNPDSLPVGTKTSEVVFNTLTYSGSITIKSLGTGRDTTFLYSEANDFSVPRTLTVHSSDGSASRNYEFDIRVHQEEGDTMSWQTLADGTAAPLTNFIDSRTLVVNHTLYIFGKTTDGRTQLVQTPTSAPTFDAVQDVSGTSVNDIDVRSIQYFKGAFHALSLGTPVQSANGADGWVASGSAQTFDALAAVSSDSLYAVSGGKMYASANGTEWNESATDSDGSLPSANTSAILQTSRVNTTQQQLLLVGSHGTMPSVWRLDIDTQGNYTGRWLSLPQTEELGEYGCPYLAQYNLLAYNQGAVLVGLNTDGSVSPFYVSQDNGRTWKTGSLPHPTISDAASVSAAVDTDNYIWLIVGGKGSVYKGRLNRLGWTEEQTAFSRPKRQ